MTLLREGCFSMVMLGLCPIMTTKYQSIGYDKEVSLGLGAITSSLIGGLITHSVDATKTCLQGDLSGKVYKNSWSAFKNIMSSAPLRGLRWRILQTTSTVYIVNKIKTLF